MLVEEGERRRDFRDGPRPAAPGIKNAIRRRDPLDRSWDLLDDEAIELMLARGTWLVPTLVAPRGVIDAAEREPPFQASVKKAREVAEIHRASFAKAVAAGVKVAMGTDSGVTPHGNNLRELALMVEGGMTRCRRSSPRPDPRRSSWAWRRARHAGGGEASGLRRRGRRPA